MLRFGAIVVISKAGLYQTDHVNIPTGFPKCKLKYRIQDNTGTRHACIPPRQHPTWTKKGGAQEVATHRPRPCGVAPLPGPAGSRGPRAAVHVDGVWGWSPNGNKERGRRAGRHVPRT